MRERKREIGERERKIQRERDRRSRDEEDAMLVPVYNGWMVG